MRIGVRYFLAVMSRAFRGFSKHPPLAAPAMEFFKNVHSVRLLGHKGKFLWADEDRRSVAQVKGQDTYGVIWRVELVPERNAIRLKSVYDLYLLASDYPFLLGATGKKVMQSFDARAENVEWQPLRAGEFVRLRTNGDKFLRANGGMPPYRNSVTHDVPVLASNQHVVLWEVEVVRRKGPMTPTPVTPPPKQKPVAPPKSPPPCHAQGPQGPGSFPPPESSVVAPLYERRPRPRRHSAPEEIEFPLPSASESSSPISPVTGLAPLQRQSSPPPSQSVDNSPHRRRARAPVRPDPDPVWDDDDDDDIDDGFPSPSPQAPRQSRHRATVSEIPTHFATRHDDDDDDDGENAGGRGDGNGDRDGEVSPSPRKPTASPVNVVGTSAASSYSPRVKSPSDYRRIFYTVAEDNGDVFANDDDETFGSFLFRGHTLMELTEALRLETGIDEDVVLCMRNPISSKLYKMRLQLPPNKAPLSVVVVRHNSQFGRTLSLPGSRRR